MKQLLNATLAYLSDFGDFDNDFQKQRDEITAQQKKIDEDIRKQREQFNDDSSMPWFFYVFIALLVIAFVCMIVWFIMNRKRIIRSQNAITNALEAFAANQNARTTNAATNNGEMPIQVVVMQSSSQSAPIQSPFPPPPAYHESEKQQQS